MAENVARDGVPLADGTVHDRPIDVPRRLVPGTGSSTCRPNRARRCSARASTRRPLPARRASRSALPIGCPASSRPAPPTPPPPSRARASSSTRRAGCPSPGSRGTWASRGGRGSAVFDLKYHANSKIPPYSYSVQAHAHALSALSVFRAGSPPSGAPSALAAATTAATTSSVGGVPSTRAFGWPSCS